MSPVWYGRFFRDQTNRVGSIGNDDLSLMNLRLQLPTRVDLNDLVEWCSAEPKAALTSERSTRTAKYRHSLKLNHFYPYQIETSWCLQVNICAQFRDFKVVQGSGCVRLWVPQTMGFNFQSSIDNFRWFGVDPWRHTHIAWQIISP